MAAAGSFVPMGRLLIASTGGAYPGSEHIASVLSAIALLMTALLLGALGAVRCARDTMAASDSGGEGHQTPAPWVHLAGLSGYIGIPLGHIIGPLYVWYRGRRVSTAIDRQGIQALNFQITVSVFAVVSLLLSFVFVGFVFLGVLILFHLTVTTTAFVQSARGRTPRYPLTVSFIRRASP
jgi:uncharacterized Tic20 family protein